LARIIDQFLNKITPAPIRIQRKYDSLDDSNMDTHKNRDILTSSEGYVDVNSKESKRKVAMRPRKVPVTRSKDFFYGKQ
jgi:hypothetical protein